MGQRFVTLFLSLMLCEIAFAISPEREQQLNAEFKVYCEEAAKYVIKNRFTIDCGDEFHHYNARAAANHYRNSGSQDLKIANYNLLHPGSNKNSYKDLGLIAQIINNYDLVSVQEIIPRLGNDMRHNQDLVVLMENGGSAELAAHYRAPGYLLILERLRALDPSWALITSPRGEASSPSSVHEMLGFYYRASKVRPKRTDHCLEQNEQSAGLACYPLFRQPFFRADVADAFSRKPFIASFESGNFDFTLMNAHVIFTSPKDEETMRWITQTAFGLDNYSDVGVGVTKETYARFAEVRLALEMLQLLIENYEEQDVMFAADMNLESKTAYWQTLARDFPKFSLYGDMATSLTPYRYSGRNETGGFSSNYDHFILNNQANQPCVRGEDGKVVVERHSYFEGETQEWIKRSYLVREETGVADEPYRISNKGDVLMKKRMHEHREFLENTLTVVGGQLVPQYDDVERELETYRRRIFDEQLNDFTYYKFYRELISDHFPISINCRT